MKHKFIFVVGGVMSGVGKGVAAASIGTILKSKGFSVTAIKADPYINVDAGTMNPTEHGEVFVTVDGDEADQDIGNYERFLNQDITSINYMTSGRVYQSVIQRERNLEFNGKCVEAIPHVSEEIINRIYKAAKKAKADITIVEIGGTIGEYQNLLFFEAIRMMKMKNPKDIVLTMVSYMPVPFHIGEMKTKPTQNAARELNSYGLQADFILCRGANPIDEKRREKLSIFCNIEPKNAISAPDVQSIYDIPLNFEKENFGNKLLKKLDLNSRPSHLKDWQKLSNRIKRCNIKINNGGKAKVKIGIAGKYFSTGEYMLADSYISIIESIKHAAWQENLYPEISWLDSVSYEKIPKKLSELDNFDGIIVPGGFGSRGVEGKILVAQYCRENKIPYFGLCYGMQIATIEFARNVCGLLRAHTEEINSKTPDPVIHIMKEQAKFLANKNYGNTMRLGTYKCELKPDTISYKAYFPQKTKSLKQKTIFERHRHRYEFNNDYRKKFEKAGLVIAGINPERNLVEIIEIKNRPFFVGTQFHPEFQSRPLNPHPLFLAFIKVASNQ